MMRILFLMGLLALSLFAASGEFSLYILKDGKPLSNQHVAIFKLQDIAPESYGTPERPKAAEFTTDKDGHLSTALPKGRYQLQLLAEENGVVQAFIKKNFVIVSSKQSQIILSLSSTNKLIFADVEAPEKIDALAKEDVKREKRVDGAVALTILSSDDNAPIEGARIFVPGLKVDAVTDKKGQIVLNIPDGNQTLSIIHTSFSSQNVKVTVIAKEMITRIVELSPASMELEEFIVLAPHVEGSVASVIQEEKQSNAITSIVGAEEMSKKGDSDAASALKRVTGVTLIGGRNIYVRGLGDRYSNVELNSMPLPSPNPTKRTVPLDIFPASVIGSMKVQKSATADVPSSFGGGYIDIRTKDQSSEDFIKVNVALKGNSNTFNKSNTYAGSSTDWLAYDNGYRDIPAGLLDATKVTEGQPIVGLTPANFSKEQISQWTQEYVERNFAVTQEDLPMGFNFGLSGAKSFEIDDKQQISVSGGYEYKQSHNHVEESYYDYDMRSDGTLYEKPTQYGTNYITHSSYEHAAIFNLSYNYDDQFKLKYTKLYTLNADNYTRVIDGILGSNDDHMIRYFLDWEERELGTDQINGEWNYVLFNSDAQLSFGGQLASASLDQPNNYKYTYILEGGQYVLNNQISNHIANNLTSEDDLTSFYLKDRQHIPMFSDKDYLEVGLSMSKKERESRQNKYFLRDFNAPDDLTQDIEAVYDEYVRPDIDYDDRKFRVSQLFQAADYFDAEVDETAVYFNSFVNPVEQVEVLFGVRYVDLSQTVWQYKQDRDNPDMSQRGNIVRVPESLVLSDFYPSLSIKYKADDNNHIDLAGSRTYIVPDLREFTSGEYFHPYEVATVVGNPNLVNTDIYNVDLKYSHYFSPTETIKAGLFYKYLDKPIEDIQVPSTSLPIYSFDNADSATLYGFEIDGRKNLEMISDYMEAYYLSGNFSYTKSDVTLREEQLDTFSTNHRELQGLSPIVINVTFGYEEEARSLALSYNFMDERIRKVGLIDDGDRYPDHVEIPPQLLDFVWIENFAYGLTGKLKLQNLLDSETVWKQGDRTTKEYKVGRKFEISLSYKY